MSDECEILVTPLKIAISIFIDTIKIELICGDEYAAQVTYEDILDRLQRGEGLALSVKQPEPAHD